jgi:hypothetical protein
MRENAFATPSELERYFSGDTIECLVCGHHFLRLGSHLISKHGMTIDEYKERFGLPWSRALVTEGSRRNSGWTEKRRTKARKLARKTRFFQLAHSVGRRQSPPIVLELYRKNLGPHASGLGSRFERRVRELFDQGFTDSEIGRVLRVARTTVRKRTIRWRGGAK